MTDKPHFVFRDGMTADRDYVQWIADIKSRYRNSQIKPKSVIRVYGRLVFVSSRLAISLAKA